MAPLPSSRRGNGRGFLVHSGVQRIPCQIPRCKHTRASRCRYILDAFHSSELSSDALKPNSVFRSERTKTGQATRTWRVGSTGVVATTSGNRHSRRFDFGQLKFVPDLGHARNIRRGAIWRYVWKYTRLWSKVRLVECVFARASPCACACQGRRRFTVTITSPASPGQTICATTIFCLQLVNASESHLAWSRSSDRRYLV